MNLKIAYMPFSNDDAVKRIAENVIANHNSQHKVDRFDPKLYTTGNKALKSVYRFQQLYIICHGSPGSNSIYATDNRAMSVTELAKQLHDEKLTIAINKVKLYCCHGGLNGAASTASKLKDAMVAAGFTDVSVYGYTMFMTGGLVGSHKRGEEDIYDSTGKTVVEVRNYAAKSVRVKF